MMDRGVQKWRDSRQGVRGYRCAELPPAPTFLVVVPSCPENTVRHVDYVWVWNPSSAAQLVVPRIIFSDGSEQRLGFINAVADQGVHWPPPPIDLHLQPGDVMEFDEIFVPSPSNQHAWVYASWTDET